MLDINLFRENPAAVREALQLRQMDPAIVDQVITLDQQRRSWLAEVETLKATRNAESRNIGKITDSTERNAKIEAMRLVGDQITELDEKVHRCESDLQAILATIPNTPAPGIPIGKDESENVVIRTVGEIPEFAFTPLPHWDLGPQAGILDFERGVKITGSRFYILNGVGARLQRALISWALDLHIRQGYEERYLPFMVRENTLFSAGQLPKFADNLYRDHEEDLWMVPTAEVPLTGMYMDEILNGEDLPLRYTAYTPCFRREKMSAGRDVRGIKRGHQFDKVEMYIYCKPEDAGQEFDKMVADAEQTCALLGLIYRVKNLCTGDLGFNAHKTYDIEVWAPGCAEWLEVSSVSHVGEFQAHRANIRYRMENGKTRHVHTLNGSGLGMPRTLIAVLENYQQADGSIVIPEVLLPWMGGIERIQAA
ncbi:MAG: serine--tRNA ligase [Chloroflexi bacterium]|nr:serine--tRNA ligase [Chloroflexota bacterium]